MKSTPPSLLESTAAPVSAGIEGNHDAKDGISNNSRNHSTEYINQQLRRIAVSQHNRLSDNFLWATNYPRHDERHKRQRNHRLENR